MTNATETETGEELDRLRAYWIKPEHETVRFIKEIDEPWDDDNGADVSPSWFRKNCASACLFSRMEMGRDCLVKVWFYRSDLAQFFRHKRSRDEFSYWVDPSWLVEVPI